jgi:hypothetical protein
MHPTGYNGDYFTQSGLATNSVGMKGAAPMQPPAA